jgi:phosphoribosylaminoimidazole-succinocarboxamide synthase
VVDVLLESDLPNRAHRGKVRDTYDLGDRLLIVATDRISAFDVVLPVGIPRKGEVLTRLSAWWFERMTGVVPHHFIALVTAENAAAVPLPLDERYYGRSMLVRKAKRLDAECVVRGYISGSGWKEYQRTGEVCGIRLPEGLRESDRLQEPIFTPTTKSEVHDEPITYEQLVELVGEEHANAMRVRSLATYGYAREVAEGKGIIIADTKFEFGLWNEEVILIDEVLTPDSSRFWPADRYLPGGPQPSFDKQPVRDWLAATGWKDGQPLPEMPADVVAATTERYLTVYRMLTGEELA